MVNDDHLAVTAIRKKSDHIEYDVFAYGRIDPFILDMVADELKEAGRHLRVLRDGTIPRIPRATAEHPTKLRPMPRTLSTYASDTTYPSETRSHGTT